MRLTIARLKESHRWRFRMLWKDKSKYVRHPVIMPSFIKDQGIQVVSAVELLKPKPLFPVWEPPVKDDPQFAPIKTLKDHKDYHDEAVYEYIPFQRLVEGEKQACLLTKTQAFQGLPQCLSDLTQVPDLPDQDVLVQRIIMQANVWDPTKQKLPRRFNNQLPGWHYKAEFGIPQRRTCSILIRNLVRLCEMIGARYPDLAGSRQIVTEPYLSAFYYHQGEKHVVIRGLHNLMVYSNRPLKPFADEEMVDESTRHVLPDMLPLLPTIDLRKQQVWRAENCTGLKEGCSHPYPHTLFMDYDKWYSVSQRNASMLMFSFGYALALAKQKYGWDATELPEPIPVQCVMTNGSNFLFSCFQLNTLNYTNNDGIKNFAWFSSEGDRPMYNKIIPKRAMLRNTRYEDYDPDVFRQILTFYANGANLVAPAIELPNPLHDVVRQSVTQ